MWTIKHISVGPLVPDEGGGIHMNSVTIANVKQEEITIEVPDVWLAKRGLSVGSEWPDFVDFSIETEALLLRKAKPEDCKAIYQNLWCHPESAKYMLWDVTTSEETAVERLKRTIAFQKVNKYALFICEKTNNLPIGFAGMHEIEPGVFEDTGIALGPKYTGKGYGTQVLNALTEESRACGGFKFIASCRKQNIVSHNLMMRCGFHFMKEEKRVDPRTGEEYILEFNEKELS